MKPKLKVKLPSGQRLLMIYSGVLTLVFAGTVLMGATSSARRATFDQITVHRINVVEPDGTLRMVVSNAAEAPGTPIKGHVYGRDDRKVAGIIFLNNEGTENGGLIYDGSRGKDGKVSSHGHLSFDNYDQDQTLVLEANQEDTTRKSTYLQINDPPGWDIEELFKLQEADAALPESAQQAAVKKFLTSRPQSQPRVFLGTRPDRSSNLVLRDAEGHKRIVIAVAADGSPVLRFLDADGKVIQQLPEAASH